MKTSNEGTKYMLNLVEGALARELKMYSHLLVCTELSIECPQKSEYIGSKRVVHTETFVLKVGDTYTYEWDEKKTIHHGTKVIEYGETRYKTFQEVRKGRMMESERNIKEIKKDIVTLNERIAAWKPE